MSSSSSSSAPPQRFNGSRGGGRSVARYQKKFVSKSDNNSSISPAAANRHPPLTTSLRDPSPATARSAELKQKPRNAGNFVIYLPHDEAVASGLGVDAGGLDAVEAQAVVDFLNDALSNILKLGPRDFWREVALNDSLHEFLDTYLQFRNRWYDFPHRGPKGVFAGVVVGELELCRRVFMVLYRMSSSKEHGAHTNDYLSVKDHTALLQEKKLLDLPKLLDICAIYGHDNGELTRTLVTNAIKAQPKLLDNIGAVTSHFLSIVHTMHDRCKSSLEVVISSGTSEVYGSHQLYKDFLEVMDFINDAITTLDAFVDASSPASFYFSTSFEMSYGNEDLLRTLARLHDSLLPYLEKGFALVTSSRADWTSKNAGDLLTDAVLSLRLLTGRIVKFGWKLLEFCYLNESFIEDSFLQTTTNMIPAKVEDPVIRGDILVQTFKEISGEVSYNFQEGLGCNTFLQNLEKEFKILSRIASLRSNGWVIIDDEHYQYLRQISMPPDLSSREGEYGMPLSSRHPEVNMDEDSIIHESKISQIKDIFPDYGKGFISACLEVYSQNPEEVIQRILEGTIHEDLCSLDTSLEQIPPPKESSVSRNDKGKGVLLETAPTSTLLSTKVDSKMQQKEEDGHPSSSSSLVHGRYVRKSYNDVPDHVVLDSRTAKDAVRSAVLASECEYEDEYDDSFDDLGLSIVESGYEDAEDFIDRVSLPGTSSAESENLSHNSNSKWSSQKKPQFFVKDGKNYSYKVSGSVGVSSVQEAALVNQAQKETIYGLGRGGNLPLGAIKKLMDDKDQDNQTSDSADKMDRQNWNPRGRGGRGRGGGGSHHRKDRAMKKHFSGLSGY